MNTEAISHVKKQILLILAAALATGYFSTPLMGLASFAYFLMALGLINRKKKSTHVKLMVSAITLDIAMVLGLELQRSAIKTASSFTMNIYQQAHVGASLVATLLYFPIIYLGYRLYKSSDLNKKLSLRRWHIPIGITSFIFRSIGFFLMFSLLTLEKH